MESGDNYKDNADIFQNPFRAVSCFVASVEQGHNYNGLDKIQYRCNCLPKKMYEDSLKFIFVYRR